MYCNHCGKKAQSTSNFCSDCGNELPHEVKTEVIRKFTEVFSSSIFVGGHLLTPDKLILDENGVTYERRNKYLIGVDKSFLSYTNISYVKIDRGVIRSSIIISSKGNRGISAKNFLIRDAKKIEQLIKQNI